MKKLRKTIKLCILRGTQGVRPPAAEGSLLPAGIRGAGIFECIVVYCCACVHVFSSVYISTSLYFNAYLCIYKVGGVFVFVLSVNQSNSFLGLLCLCLCFIFYVPARFFDCTVV